MVSSTLFFVFNFYLKFPKDLESVINNQKKMKRYICSKCSKNESTSNTQVLLCMLFV